MKIEEIHELMTQLELIPACYELEGWAVGAIEDAVDYIEELLAENARLASKQKVNENE